MTVIYSSREAGEVQRTADVSGGLWLPWVTDLPGTGDTLQVTDTNAISQPKHFYRVQVSAAANL